MTKWLRVVASRALFVACACSIVFAQGQIDITNWGSITTPVYGTSETGIYSSAELFAGPNKLGSYYAGVLPNGRKVTPAGTNVQVGMNPLGVTLTPDGKFAITSNDDEREGGYQSFVTNAANLGGYSLSVVDTDSMKVVSQINTGKFYIGLQVTGTGPYVLWASGGPDNDVKVYNISTVGLISADPTTPSIPVKPILPSSAGWASNYIPDLAMNTADANGFKPPVPSNFDRVNGAQTTFPAGSALSPDGKFLYVARNGDNSVAVIETATKTVVKQLPAGYFPYSVAVSPTGSKIAVSNWGITEYKFFNPKYSTDGKLVSLGATPDNLPAGFFVAPTSTSGDDPKTSSISIFLAPAGNGAGLVSSGAIYEGAPLNDTTQVGDTHPSAT